MAIDFEEVADYFIDAIANRVVEKLREQDGSSWPGVVETKDLNLDNAVAALMEQEEAKATVESYDEIDTAQAERKEFWDEFISNKGKERAHDLLLEFGEKRAAFGKLSDGALAVYISDLEALTGKHVDDVQDVSEPEAEDVELPELTPETAMELELDDLRGVAIDQGLTEADLKGLDVDGIVALLFGEEPEAVAVEEVLEEEGEGYTEEEIRDMSIAELKEIADANEVEYAPRTSRNDLIEKILQLLGE